MEIYRLILTRWLVLVVACSMTLFVVGCNPASLAEQYRAIAIRPSVEPPTSGNRLLVQSFNGNIFTIRPDGTGRFYLTNDASATRQYQQPTWSPDAQRIAIARSDLNEAGVSSALLLVSHDNAEGHTLTTPFPPFYIFWSPSGEQLAYLSNWSGLEGPSMALRIVDVTRQVATTLAEGSPYYFSWAPNGGELLAHIGSNRMELQSISGERRALRNTAAGFAAPQWSADGERLVYALDTPDTQQLIIADLQGRAINEITDFEERISFLLSPDGERLAYVLTPSNAGANTLGPLYVADVETLRTRELTDQPVWGFFWSPDSAKLAYLAMEQPAGQIWLRWWVWDGQANIPYSRFLPSRTFLENYLVFSDQYAQSAPIWSPDSSAFAFAGRIPNNRPGVWVQALGGGEPMRVADGVYVTWSPK
jgi:TolB protein